MEEQNDKPVERPEEKPEPVVVEAKKPVEDVLLPQTPPPEIETPKLPEVASAEVTLTPPPPQPKAGRKPPPKKRRQSARSRKTGRWIAPGPVGHVKSPGGSGGRAVVEFGFQSLDITRHMAEQRQRSPQPA